MVEWSMKNEEEMGKTNSMEPSKESLCDLGKGLGGVSTYCSKPNHFTSTGVHTFFPSEAVCTPNHLCPDLHVLSGKQEAAAI